MTDEQALWEAAFEGDIDVRDVRDYRTARERFGGDGGE
jgi:hypothetical protein